MRLAIFFLLFTVVAFSVEADEVDSILGKRFIKSVGYGYLSATIHTQGIFERRLSWRWESKGPEIWRIREHGRNVSIMSMYHSGMYVNGYPFYAGLSKWDIDALWIPTKHEDGSWSFKNANYDDIYLSALSNGFVGCYGSSMYDKFWIHEADD